MVDVRTKKMIPYFLEALYFSCDEITYFCVPKGSTECIIEFNNENAISINIENLEPLEAMIRIMAFVENEVA